jgi:ATP-dependent protease ClpP protease subunit
MLWPQRHFGSLAAEFAQSMITPAVGDRWGEPEIQAERRREIERSQAQLTVFYQNETERQEARINRESDERIAALTGRDS